MTKTTADIIEIFRPVPNGQSSRAVGPLSALASHLGVTKQAVHYWAQTGRIPYRHHASVAKLAWELHRTRVKTEWMEW